MSSGASPLPMGVKRPKPAIAPGTPRAPSNNFTQQINLQFYRYATPKLLGLGRNPFRPLERSHVQSVSRYGRPEPYTQTLHNRSGRPSLVKGTTRPQTSQQWWDTRTSLLIKYKQIFRNIFYSRRNNSRHSKETKTFRNLA